MNPVRQAGLITLVILSLALIPASFTSALAAWNFTAVGDIVYDSIGKKVAATTKAQPNYVSVLLGDYYGKEKEVLAIFQEPTIALLAACGNHDDCSDVLTYDGMAFKSYPIVAKRKNVCFIITNTEQSIGSQKSRIESGLNNCQSNPDVKHIIFAQHKASVTNTGAHHKESETSGYRQQYVTWKENFPKFDLLLQAHNHNFQICEPINPDVLVVTIGTGGRTPYAIGGGNDDNCSVNKSGHKYDGPALITVNDSGYNIKKININ